VTRLENKVCHGSVGVITNKLSALIEIVGFVIVLQINLEQAVIAIIFFVLPGVKHFTPGIPVIFMPRPSAANLPILLGNIVYLFPPPTKNLGDAIPMRTANN
jgi:hypothetical protein